MYSLLKIITKHPACCCFQGASKDDIQTLNLSLQKCGFHSIPQEYTLFLSQYNGLIFDGLELHGTQAYERIKQKYTFESLVSLNYKYAKTPYFANKLILGEIPEYFLIYNQENNTYEIVDRINLDSQIAFKTLNDMLLTILPFILPKN